MLANATALADELTAAGLRIVSGGTDTGLMLVDLSARAITGDVASKGLEGRACCQQEPDPVRSQGPPETLGPAALENAGTLAASSSRIF